MTLLVSEVFGPTVQGEGPSLGRRCGFVRLGLCNLDCSWCDTPYTWDWTGKNGPPQDRGALVHMEAAELLSVVEQLGVDMLVVSGGEPLVQRRQLEAWLATLGGRYRIEIETNGTVDPAGLAELVDRFNVTPKLTHSGVRLERAWRAGPLTALTASGRAVFKVVCRDADDVMLLVELVAKFCLVPGDVWVMPEGIDATTIAAHGAAIAETAIHAGFNVTTRLHVALWGNRRGI